MKQGQKPKISNQYTKFLKPVKMISAVLSTALPTVLMQKENKPTCNTKHPMELVLNELDQCEHLVKSMNGSFTSGYSGLIGIVQAGFSGLNGYNLVSMTLSKQKIKRKLINILHKKTKQTMI